MSTLERLKQKKVDLLRRAEGSKAKLDAQIAKARADLARAERVRAQTARAHLKNVFGGWCLAMLEDELSSPDFKQILLASTDEAVTHNPNNLARRMFESHKQKAGL